MNETIIQLTEDQRVAVVMYAYCRCCIECGEWFDPEYEGVGNSCDRCVEMWPDSIGDRIYHEMVDQECMAGGTR